MSAMARSEEMLNWNVDSCQDDTFFRGYLYQEHITDISNLRDK